MEENLPLQAAICPTAQKIISHFAFFTKQANDILRGDYVRPAVT
jgi:hypothetical protein